MSSTADQISITIHSDNSDLVNNPRLNINSKEEWLPNNSQEDEWFSKSSKEGKFPLSTISKKLFDVCERILEKLQIILQIIYFVRHFNGITWEYVVSHVIALIESALSSLSSSILIKSRPELVNYMLEDNGYTYPNSIHSLLGIGYNDYYEHRKNNLSNIMMFSHWRKMSEKHINHDIDLPVDWFNETQFLDKYLQLKNYQAQIFPYNSYTGHFMDANYYGTEIVALEMMKLYTFLMKNEEILAKKKIWMNEPAYDLNGFMFDRIEKKLLEQKLHSFSYQFQDIRQKRLHSYMKYYLFFVFSILFGLVTLVRTIIAFVSICSNTLVFHQHQNKQ